MVYEHELQSMFLTFKFSNILNNNSNLIIGLIKSGEKLQNAYIYALFSESFDIDKELFDHNRINQPFDTFINKNL